MITNWHVVTGRHPEDPKKLLPGYPNSPAHIQLQMSEKSDKNVFAAGPYIPLYDEQNKPSWYESTQRNNIDLVALKIDFDELYYVPCIQDFAPYANKVVVPGLEVVVVGFPFGRTHPYPVWKKAMVASEVAYTINGKAYTYLDTPGRPGMSGSPVYAIGSGFEVTKEQKAALEDPTSPLPERAKIYASIRDSMGNSLPVLEFVGVCIQGPMEIKIWTG